MRNLTDELEDRYERNEVAFDQGRIAEKFYLKNVEFYQSVARLIESTRDLELRTVDLQSETFIGSLLRELNDYNLNLSVTAHGEARIQKQSAETKIMQTLRQNKDWVHELLLSSIIDDATPVLERLAGINAIAKKTLHNNNYYRA